MFLSELYLIVVHEAWRNSRSPFPPLLVDQGVVAQIISVSKDGLGFPKEHL